MFCTNGIRLNAFLTILRSELDNCAKIELDPFSIMSTLFSYLVDATPKSPK